MRRDPGLLSLPAPLCVAPLPSLLAHGWLLIDAGVRTQACCHVASVGREADSRQPIERSSPFPTPCRLLTQAFVFCLLGAQNQRRQRRWRRQRGGCGGTHVEARGREGHA